MSSAAETLDSRFVQAPAKVMSLLMQLLVLDNRGVGRSSMPCNRNAYTSTTMAVDVLCIMVSSQCALEVLLLTADVTADSRCTCSTSSGKALHRWAPN